MLGLQETNFGFEHKPNLADHVTKTLFLLKPNNHVLTLSTSILILPIYYKMRMEALRKKKREKICKKSKKAMKQNSVINIIQTGKSCPEP